jgi:hypothetical protein
MDDTDQPPIACCLGATEYQSRIAWIENLTRQALRSHARDDLVLRLSYTPEAAAEVRKMVEQERICCPFLTFDLHQSYEAASVTITATEAARDSADMLFGQFLSGLRHAITGPALPPLARAGDKFHI